MSLLEECLGVLISANCSDHQTDMAEAEVAEGIAAATWCYCWKDGPPSNCGSYCDTSGVALVRLVDGRYAVIDESSDTSGHG